MSNNWKMRCVDSGKFDILYTEGKIYEVVDGKLCVDNGDKFEKHTESFKQWENYSSARWELIEEHKQALEVECYNIENVVLFKVLHQDDNKIEKQNFKWTSGYGLEIISNGKTRILPNSIHIKGKHPFTDQELLCYDFECERHAVEYVKKVHQAVAALNESLADKPKGRWKPNDADDYWCVDKFNEVSLTNYKSDFFDNKRWNENDMFQTKEEAERKKEIFNKLYELRHEFSFEEWKDFSIEKWSLSFNFTHGCPMFTAETVEQCEGSQFKTKEDAEEFFEFCGADDYVKYILGVY